ncbi:MAG: hypothetical protein V3V78_02295 [Candidatus Woesearchaeota archaeon]
MAIMRNWPDREDSWYPHFKELINDESEKHTKQAYRMAINSDKVFPYIPVGKFQAYCTKIRSEVGEEESQIFRDNVLKELGLGGDEK